MIIFSLVYILAIAIIVLIIGFFVTAKKRNIIVAIPITVLGLPIIFGGFLFALKDPIQQGKILSNTMLGPLLNFVSPPPDLYNPLASGVLKPEKTKYTLLFSHKYLGNHTLMVSSPRPPNEENPRYDDISITFSVFNGNEEIFKMANVRPKQFWGQNDYGAYFAWYRVPKDMPVSKQLKAKIEIAGTLRKFLQRRGHTILKILKYSDE